MGRNQTDVSHELLGRRFFKVGDKRHTWVVSALKSADACGRPFAILISEGDFAAEEVDLSHLGDVELYVPAR